jgi:hypothetical protein
MTKKRAIWLGVLVGGVLSWIFWGRYAVEGGKAPWAVINDRNDVLKAALASGVSQEQKEEAMWRAVHKENAEAIRLLAAAGVDPNKVKIGDNCLLEYPTSRFSVHKALLESGADPRACPSGGKSYVAHLVSGYATGAPEPELLALVQLLVKKGVPIPPSAITHAETNHLEKVAAYLRNPAATVDAGRTQALALRGPEIASVDRDDLAKVCEGTGLGELPPYKKEPGLVSPAFVFQITTDEPFDATRVVPRWWIADRLQHTQVVACARVVDKRPAKRCTYQGGVSVTFYDATYDLSVREAKTANPIASKKVEIAANPPSECSMFQMGGSESVYPEFAAELLPLLGETIGAESSRTR